MEEVNEFTKEIKNYLCVIDDTRGKGNKLKEIENMMDYMVTKKHILDMERQTKFKITVICKLIELKSEGLNSDKYIKLLSPDKYTNEIDKINYKLNLFCNLMDTDGNTNYIHKNIEMIYGSDNINNTNVKYIMNYYLINKNIFDENAKKNIRENVVNKLLEINKT